MDREPVGAGVGGSTYGGTYGGRTSDETSMMEPVRDEPYPPSIPQQQDVPDYGSADYGATDYAHYDEARYDDDDDDDFDEPEDEPAPQPTSPGDAARIASMNTDVYVVDGRPRYHLRGCVHLMGRENESAAGERGGRARLLPVRGLRAEQLDAGRRPPRLGARQAFATCGVPDNGAWRRSRSG